MNFILVVTRHQGSTVHAYIHYIIKRHQCTVHLFCYTATVHQLLMSVILCMIIRFSGWRKGDKNYDGIGAHGFNVWEVNKKCVFQKDGVTKMGCNGIDAAMECTMKFMSFEASL